MPFNINNSSPFCTLVLCLVLVGALTACTRTAPDTSPASASPTPNWYQVDTATAGTITGKIIFTGKAPIPKTIAMGNDLTCVKLHQGEIVKDESLLVAKDGALANAFVYIKQGMEGKQFAPPAAPAVIDQKGCWFGPRVLGVQVGQPLKVTNSDPLTHNIHPMPERNRDWNQSQPPAGEPLLRKFMQPEVMIRVKCNIHGWMRAWVGVVAHPYFAVTGADGTFALRDVPPGNYTLEVWQEQLGKQEQTLTLAPRGKGELTFTYTGESLQ